VSASWVRGRRRYAALFLAASCGAAAAAIVVSSGSSTSSSSALPAPLRPSTGKAVYVSPSGNDSGPGTVRRPWRSIRHAIQTLTPGETAYLRAGTYIEGGRLNSLWWERSGSPSSPITIRGYPGESRRVIVKTRIELEGDYLRLAKLVIARNHAYSDFDGARTGDVGVWLAGRYDVLEHVEVRKGNMSGVFATGTYDQILASYIHDNGRHWNLDHGIYLAGSNQLVANNVIDHNFAYGVSIWPSCNACVITDNTLVQNGRSGILIAGGSSDSVAANNITAYNGEYGIRTFQIDGSGNEVVANLDYANKAGAYCVAECGGGASVSHALHGNPRFVVPGRDYRLRAGSPAIDAGIAAYAPPDDFNGTPRNRGTGPDLGAFER
jgi:parallel beta-helix repeat protein